MNVALFFHLVRAFQFCTALVVKLDELSALKNTACASSDGSRRVALFASSFIVVSSPPLSLVALAQILLALYSQHFNLKRIGKAHIANSFYRLLPVDLFDRSRQRFDSQ